MSEKIKILKIADVAGKRLKKLNALLEEKQIKITSKENSTNLKNFVDDAMRSWGYDPEDDIAIRSAIFREHQKRSVASRRKEKRMREKERLNPIEEAEIFARNKKIEEQQTFDEFWKDERMRGAIHMAYERRDHLVPDL